MQAICDGNVAHDVAQAVDVVITAGDHLALVAIEHSPHRFGGARTNIFEFGAMGLVQQSIKAGVAVDVVLTGLNISTNWS